LGFCDWIGPAGPEAYPSIQAAFGDNVLHNSEYRQAAQGVHVMPGVRCRSLAGINIPRSQFRLYKNNFGELRAEIHDGQKAYSLKVSSRQLREAFSAGADASAAIAVLPARDMLHLRLGLAHPYARANDVEKCYMMLNGVL
jgi:hypothetical protein